MAQSHTLPDLPYDYGELEPVMSGKVMELHHGKHHKGYVNNLNQALEQYAEAEAKNDLTKMILLQSAINFNGGGHLNHAIFWTNLAPEKKGGGVPPTGPLADAIVKGFGSHDQLIEAFNKKTIPIQGSGWGWLGYNKEKERLELAACANHELVMQSGLIPLLCIDVWEHAYYLQYQNLRADYVKSVWSIVNWKNVEERYVAATT